ncbi:MAG: hypothetical protein ACTSYS_11165, partial [Promethearchaeota archaeon]
MYLVYQVLGNSKYSDRRYHFPSEGFDVQRDLKLSSIATLFKLHESSNHGDQASMDDGILKLLIPHSIYTADILDDIVTNNRFDSRKLELFHDKFIKNKELTDDLNFLTKELGYHYDFLPIPSMGSYLIPAGNDENAEQELVTFKGNSSTIMHVIFSDIIKTVFFDDDAVFNKHEIIADISTGFNPYIMALIEALRNAEVFERLLKIMQQIDRDSFNEYYYQYSDPIFVGRDVDKKDSDITLNPLRVKAFFDMPVADKNKFVQLSNWYDELIQIKDGGSIDRRKEVRTKFSGQKFNAFLTHFFNIFKISFNAIKYNVPLFFYESKKFLNHDMFGTGFFNDKRIVLDHILKMIDFINYNLMKMGIQEKKNGGMDERVEKTINYDLLNGRYLIN